MGLGTVKGVDESVTVYFLYWLLEEKKRARMPGYPHFLGTQVKTASGTYVTT